jgi:hypothetical protein
MTSALVVPVSRQFAGGDATLFGAFPNPAEIPNKFHDLAVHAPLSGVYGPVSTDQRLSKGVPRMNIAKKAIVGGVLAGGLLFAGGMAPANAAPVVQGGLVNVGIGDVNVLNNAHIGIAAQVVAQICGVNVGPVAVLATQVTRSGLPVTVCTSNNEPVTISQ